MRAGEVEEQSRIEALEHDVRGARVRVEVDGDHEAEAAHLLHVRQRGQALAHVRPHLLNLLGDAAFRQLAHGGTSGGDGQTAAAERGAVVARRERGRHFFARGAHAHGESRGDALGDGDDVRRDAEMLEAEGVGAATEHAALDLVAHEQRAALLGEATGRLQELGRAGMHAALALHALHHDGADGIPLRFEQGLERRHVVDGRAGEAVGQRPERLLFRRLGRGGQRGERAAMEARIERDDDAGRGLARSRNGGLVGAFGLGARGGALLGVQARKLERAFVRLGAGVGEEASPRRALGFGNARVQQVGHSAGDLAAMLDVIVVAHVHERARLLLERGDERRMAVAEACRPHARHEVKIGAARVVDHLHASSGDELDGLAGVGLHEVGRFEFALLDVGHDVASLLLRSSSSCAASPAWRGAPPAPSQGRGAGYLDPDEPSAA